VLFGRERRKPPGTWSIELLSTRTSIVHVRHAPDVDTKTVTRG
jgi:hypothetical protein